MATSRSKAEVDIELFHDIFQASPIGIVVETLDGQPLFVNPAFCSFLGFTEEELRQKHCVDFSPAEDAQKDWTLFQQLRAGLIDRYQLEKRYFRKDGSLVWGRLSLSVLRNDPASLVIAMVEDITEKKSAEETRFRHTALIESSQDAIISKNLDAVITGWNEGAQRMFGYTEAEALGQPITILIPPDLLEEENKILERLRAEGRIEHYETIRVTKSGKRVDVSLTIGPIKDSNGTVVGFAKIACDITKRKHAERALIESEERLLLAARVARMFAYSWDATTDSIQRSGESKEILGIDDYAANTGADVSAMVYPDDRERLESALAKLTVENPILQISYRIVRPDGRITWLERNSRAYFDEQGRLVRLIGMVRDVTEHKQHEDALRASEEKFRRVFLEAGTGMVMVSLEGRFLAANPTFCDCLGYTEQALLDMTVESITFAEDWPMFAERLRGALLEGRGFQWLQKRCLHKSGRIVYTETSTSVIRNGEGEPLFFVGQVLDITSRKKAEEALSGLTRRLIEAQEQERTRIARELHDDVSQQLALLAVELDQWGTSIAHDPDFHQHLDHAKQRITEIGRDVQSVSHQLHSSKLEYLGLVAAAKSFSKEVSETNNVHVDFKGDGIPRTLPNEVSLSLFRILQQALHNAVEHSGAKHIEVSLWEQSNEIHLRVKDFGKGFDLMTAMQGAGLGLTSMHERVRLVNGNIAIDSKPMRGTTVCVRVPLNSDCQAEKQAG